MLRAFRRGTTLLVAVVMIAAVASISLGGCMTPMPAKTMEKDEM